MEENLKNLNLISSVDAAELFGITNDYVTMLCRRKKISGQLIGKRLWFVSKDELATYLSSMKQKEIARHEALSQQMKQEYVQVSVVKKIAEPVLSPIQRRSLGSKYIAGAVIAMILSVSVVTAAPYFPRTNQALAAATSLSSPFFSNFWNNAVSFVENLFSPKTYLVETPKESPVASVPTASSTIVNNYPVVERTEHTVEKIIERVVSGNGIARTEFEDRLLALTQFVIDYNNTRIFLGGHSGGGGSSSVTNVTNITSSGTSNFGQTFEIASGALVPTTTLGIIVASSTIAGDLTVTGAFRVASLASCDTIDTDSNGNFSCGTDQTSTGMANTFNFATNFGVLSAATSSVLWAQGGIFASSTSHFATADFAQGFMSFASSTIGNGVQGLIVNGSATTTGSLSVSGQTVGPSFADALRSGTPNFYLDGSGFFLRNSALISWSSIADAYNGAGDLNLTRGAASTLYINNISGDHNATIIAGSLGLGTTSPYAKLSVSGEVVAANFTATTTATSTFPRALFTQATTTNFAITGISSSLLKTLSNGAVVGAIAGTDYLTSANVAGYPFTTSNNFGQTVSATSTPIWAQAGIMSSSTAQLTNANIYGNFNFATTSSNAS
ncbi:hypothetical protein KW798_02230, partial [Candidatus Parcubacteria bacterium]|nr:hypothetical protein [Candidatus Parcubacteria bacterium]